MSIPRRLSVALGLVTLGWSLACGGMDAPAASKPRATTKSSAGKVSKDGKKKKQQVKKKTHAPDGEVVWVVVEEWVPIDEWDDDVLVVSDWVEADDVVILDDDFDEELWEEELVVVDEEVLDTGI